MLILCDYKKQSLKAKECSINRSWYKREAMGDHMHFGKKMKIIYI